MGVGGSLLVSTIPTAGRSAKYRGPENVLRRLDRCARESNSSRGGWTGALGSPTIPVGMRATDGLGALSCESCVFDARGQTRRG